MRKRWLIIPGVVVGIVLLILLTLRLRYGGGGHFADRSTAPLWPESVLQKVADLEMPPGNIAVNKKGRIFFTFHPEGRPEVKVAELIDGQAKPFPTLEFQQQISTPLSVRIDRSNRLWVLDLANHGVGTPRLFAIDIDTGKVLHQHDFSSEIAPLGSHMNDFQIDAQDRFIYIADASIMGLNPAIVVYDIKNQKSRRLLEKHPSVMAEDFSMTVGGREMVVLGVFTIKPNVDSIALDRRGEYLYYAAVNAGSMYRIKTAALLDEKLSAEQLASKVETYAEKTHSDGITIDNVDNIYLSDPEHNAVHVLDSNRDLKTLVKSHRLRWPDGFSYGPENYIYVTCSALHQVIFRSSAFVKSKAPYQIFRFKGLAKAEAGH